MIRKNERVGKDDVLSPAGHEYNDFGDVVWCQGLAAAIGNESCLEMTRRETTVMEITGRE